YSAIRFCRHRVLHSFPTRRSSDLSFCCIEEFANDPGLLTLSGLPGLRGPPRALGAMGPSGAVGLPVLAEHFPQHAADLAHRRVSLDGPNQVGHQVVPARDRKSTRLN